MTIRSKVMPEASRDTAEVTIHDVAREAKVSIATVSRVLNGSDTVRDSTRERVQEVVRRLRYVPHGGARSLIKRETRTIGVLLPDMFGEFFSEVIRGLDQVARQRHYSLLVTCTHGESQSAEAMVRTMHGKVDGLVVLSSNIEMYAPLKHLLRRTPVVFLNHVQGPGADQFDSISVDNHSGAMAMTRYLMGLGHERIVFVKGPDGNGDADERLQGYREAMKGQPGGALNLMEISGDFSEGSGYQATGRIVQMGPRPTAIFAANDAMAIGVLCGLKERGMRVPEDISLAGFDDIPMVRYLSPPLSSIRTPIPELGSGAAERLLAMIEAGGAIRPRQQTLEVLLVARASTGPPPSEWVTGKALDSGKLSSRAPPVLGPLDGEVNTPPQAITRTTRRNKP
jgi:LacI family transcriptional regulator